MLASGQCMTLLDLKRKISETQRRSNQEDRVCHLDIEGRGRFRIDGNYIILIREDGTYHRIDKQKLTDEIFNA